MEQKYCSRCGTFTDNFYPSQTYICKKCVSIDRQSRYIKKGRKHLRINKVCTKCGTKENLAKNGFYKDGTQRYSSICNVCKKSNNKWQELNKDKINAEKRIARSMTADTTKANARTLVRKWHHTMQEREEHRFEYWLECNEHKPYLVFCRFFANGLLREDLIK